MNELVRLLGIGVLTAVLSAAVGRVRQEAAVFVSAAGGILILLSVVGMLSPYFDTIKSLDSDLPEYASVMLKALGIGLITKFASDTCRDLGQNSIASKLELAGRAEILIVGLPVLKRLIEAVRAVLVQ